MNSDPLLVWQALSLPGVDADEWTDHAAKAGLAEIKRLRGQLDAAQAVLVRVVARTAGRDTKAQLARGLSMSDAEAARAVKVAEVVERVPEAAAALADGSATAEHLARLASVTDRDAAGQLLALAPALSPEDFGKAVDKHRLDATTDSWRERQRARRFLSFFRGEDGCIGIRGLFPTLEGERVKAALNAICDDAYRHDYPDRAQTAGGNDVEPRDRRSVDALITAVCGDTALDRGRTIGNENDEATTRPRSRGGSGKGSTARTALIVTVNAETLDAEVVSGGPVPVADVIDLIDDARTDVYGLIRDMTGAVLRFGRDQRLGSALQRLVLAVRDGGCSAAGCTVSWNRCDVHHEPPFEQGGRTDIETMDLRCSALHHPHRHRSDTNHHDTFHGRPDPPERRRKHASSHSPPRPSAA